MLKRYIEYLKDNPEGYWFKRKLYGWGWTPAKWQGWLVIAVFSALVAFSAWKFIEHEPGKFLLSVLAASLLLIAVSYFKGESPRWQWGDEGKNGPE